MLQYCIRRDTPFKQLGKEGWDIPSAAKGYILLRDAHLPDKTQELIEDFWKLWVRRNAEVLQALGMARP